MNSKRLPGKVLAPIIGRPMICHQLTRIQQSKFAANLVVATTLERSDDQLSDTLTQENYQVFRGNHLDVLDRYYSAAKQYSAEHIVRITADCPLIDSSIIDMIIEDHLANDSDYTSNTLTPTFPDGQDVEVFTFQALEKAWKRAKYRSEREHVTLYIKNNLELFAHRNIESTSDLSHHRWTVDENVDLEFVKLIFSHFGQEYASSFSMEDVLKFLQSNPEIMELNQTIARDEGLAKSLAEDEILHVSNICTRC